MAAQNQHISQNSTTAGFVETVKLQLRKNHST